MTIAHAHIIGAGGTGGFLIPPLVRLLQFHANAAAPAVHVHDGDSFEPHNIHRQACGTEAMGRNKAEWIQQLCHQQGLTITAHPQYVDRQCLRDHLRSSPASAGAALVVACVDNDATRKAILQELELLRSDFFFCSPGNSAAEDPAAAIKGNVHWFGRIDGQTVGLNPALVEPNIEHPQDAIPRQGGCMEQQASAPQLITANAMAAALTLAVIQNFLDGLLPAQSSACFFNGRTFALSAS